MTQTYNNNAQQYFKKRFEIEISYEIINRGITSVNEKSMKNDFGLRRKFFFEIIFNVCTKWFLKYNVINP